MPSKNRTRRTRVRRKFPAICEIFDTSRSVFWQSHPATIRMLLALSSLGWAICLICDPLILTKWPYQYMLAVMPYSAWLLCFLCYFAGIFWRIFDRTPRIHWALLINALGCFLWFTLTICITLRAGRFIPGSSLEAVTCVFAAWALIRTGLGKDVGTP